MELIRKSEGILNRFVNQEGSVENVQTFFAIFAKKAYATNVSKISITHIIKDILPQTFQNASEAYGMSTLTHSSQSALFRANMMR